MREGLHVMKCKKSGEKEVEWPIFIIFSLQVIFYVVDSTQKKSNIFFHLRYDLYRIWSSPLLAPNLCTIQNNSRLLWPFPELFSYKHQTRVIKNCYPSHDNPALWSSLLYLEIAIRFIATMTCYKVTGIWVAIQVIKLRLEMSQLSQFHLINVIWVIATLEKNNKPKCRLHRINCGMIQDLVWERIHWRCSTMWRTTS